MKHALATVAAILGALGLVCWLRRRHDPYRHPLANLCKVCDRYVDLGHVDPERRTGTR